MFAAARNTIAQARVRYNKQKELYSIVVAFNVTERNERTGKLKFPVASKCAYVSGDFAINELERQLQRAAACVSTTQIVIAD